MHDDYPSKNDNVYIIGDALFLKNDNFPGGGGSGGACFRPGGIENKLKQMN